MADVRLAFLWHMHQPLYREPESGEYVLPWVRLHATRAYYDMAWMLERHPAVRCTVNFVPSLLEQLDDYVAGRAVDHWLALTRKQPAELAAAERELVLKNFFMVDWTTSIRPLPRYWQLLEKRGKDLSRVDLPRVARTFSEEELLDLQVLFNLAWFGFGALAGDEGLRALKAKGRDFTAADKAYLLAAQQRVMAEIVPRWRKLAERGQVELSSTPYFHPILPLVCDTDSALRAMPGIPLPLRFHHPEDARWQVRAAIDSHQRRFGAPPAGMWPAEGSVSPEALEVLSREGVRWAASDEGVLMKSLPPDTSRAGALYKPWRVAAGERDVAMLFRDRGLSDLVGFTYQSNAPEDAADDFANHLLAIGRAWDEVPGPGGPATVGVFLDGENPWEHYEGSGEKFLDALYAKLATTPGIVTVTMSEATATAPPPALPRIHTGSWIEASFRIWIGHEEDRLAWAALEKARAAVERAKEAGAAGAGAVEKAMEHLHAAEGSDWFWWYGEDFVSENAVEFDQLFRAHVVRACRLVGATPPTEALAPIKRMRIHPGAEALMREPTALIAPALDGRVTSYFEWRGAGHVRGEQLRGAMFGGAAAFGDLHYGFSLSHLYLRLDPAEAAGLAAQAADRVEVALIAEGRESAVRFPVVQGGSEVPGEGPDGPLGRAAFADIMELEIPFQSLGLKQGEKVAVSLRVFKGSVEVERLPRVGFVSFGVPDEDFERIHWRV